MIFKEFIWWLNDYNNLSNFKIIIEKLSQAWIRDRDIKIENQSENVLNNWYQKVKDFLCKMIFINCRILKWVLKCLFIFFLDCWLSIK
jgi:hypothetical protein